MLADCADYCMMSLMMHLYWNNGKIPNPSHHPNTTNQHIQLMSEEVQTYR